jgi:hypothetical protein
MAKGEGAGAKVVRLTPEQQEQAAKNKALLLNKRRARIKAQNEEKIRVLESAVKNGFSLVAPTARQKVEAQYGPIGRLFQYCKKMKERITRTAWYYFMRKSGFATALVLAGSFTVSNFGADGVMKWTTGCEYNQITTVGLNKLLDVMFHNDTQVATWYIGLVDSSPTYAAGDTMASHAGWTEYTEYSETNRQTWTEDAAAAGSITNSTTVDFSMNATGTVAGMFLVSDSTKSGTAGMLWSGLNFSGGNQSVSNGDTLKVTYTLTASA